MERRCCCGDCWRRVVCSVEVGEILIKVCEESCLHVLLAIRILLIRRKVFCRMHTSYSSHDDKLGCSARILDSHFLIASVGVRIHLSILTKISGNWVFLKGMSEPTAAKYFTPLLRKLVKRTIIRTTTRLLQAKERECVCGIELNR